MAGISRRAFLEKASLLVGSSYPAMLALGLIKAAPAKAFHLDGSGAGKHIIILGAGLAGMTAAYELKKLGYTCTVLEARDRSGGRVWTVRKGTRETELDGPEQVAKFDEGSISTPGRPASRTTTRSRCTIAGSSGYSWRYTTILMRPPSSTMNARAHWRTNQSGFGKSTTTCGATRASSWPRL